MKKYLLIFPIIICFTLTNCSNGLNKSIVEPLTEEELKRNIEKDPDFGDMYTTARFLRVFISGSDVRKAKYSDITYKRLKKYIDKISDTVYTNKIYDELRAEYSGMYPLYEQKVDSVLSYWKEYKDNHSLGSLLSVEYERVKVIHGAYGWTTDVYVGFKVSPLQGPVEQFVFEYCIVPKISNTGKMDYWDTETCEYTKPIEATQILYWKPNIFNSYYDNLKDQSNEELLRDFDFLIKIKEVRINGKNMSESLSGIPETVSHVLDSYDYEVAKNKYYVDIIKEFIDPKYLSWKEFSVPRSKETIKKIDPLVYDLLEEWGWFNW